MRINLNLRKKQILGFLASTKEAGAHEILDYLVSNALAEISRPTLNRDLEELLEAELILRTGSGPSTSYSITTKARLTTYIQPDTYFDLPPEQRNASEKFNWQLFELLTDTKVFSEDEQQMLDKWIEKYREQRNSLPSGIIRKEIERVTIELSWKSSAIEGNTYSLLETENLIKNAEEATGKTSEETQMILNHKQAIDYIFENSGEFKTLSLSKIEDLHSLLTEELSIEKGLRKSPVGITGTLYRPLDNYDQIREALERTIELVNNTEDSFSKSLLTILLISYIQPFEDGNKRTSRILGNAVLLAGDVFPLSFRSVSEVRYKEGTLLFYEQNNLSLFKDIFLEQAEFAVSNYFQA